MREPGNHRELDRSTRERAAGPRRVWLFGRAGCERAETSGWAASSALALTAVMSVILSVDSDVCGDSRAANASAPPSPAAPLFTCDFEADEWYREWDLKKPDPRTDTVAKDDARKFESLRGKALRIRVDKGGHYGVSLQYKFRKRTGAEPEEIYFRYYLRLADDWNPVQGGKLPGISGTYGRAGWGGRPSHGNDGWSARGLFKGQKGGKTPVGYYCYHADMKGQYGSGWVWDKEERGFLENNRWYCIEQYAKMNTPGKNDGILRAWVDGELAFEKTDIRMRDVATLAIEAIWINVYHGGKWAARTEDHLYIDDVAISRERIGPAH